MTLIEEMRSKPETVVEETIIGVDPDLHNLGIALITSRTTSKEATRILRVRLFELIVSKQLKGAAAVEAMACLVNELTQKEATTVADAAFIEGQRIYPHDDIPRLVGQGNDLINLAQVAGMATQIFWPKDPERLNVVWPQTWKGQAAKETMHASAMRMLRVHAPVMEVTTMSCKDTSHEFLTWGKQSDEDIQDQLGIHVMDAVCLALWGAGR